jgi:hypothetical protein
MATAPLTRTGGGSTPVRRRARRSSTRATLVAAITSKAFILRRTTEQGWAELRAKVRIDP